MFAPPLLEAERATWRVKENSASVLSGKMMVEVLVELDDDCASWSYMSVRAFGIGFRPVLTADDNRLLQNQLRKNRMLSTIRLFKKL